MKRLSVCSCLMLIACGGGAGYDGTGSGGQGSGSLPAIAVSSDAQPFAPKAGSDAVIGIQANNLSGIRDIRLFQVTGLENTSTNALELSDGVVLFADSDGFQNGVAQDGTDGARFLIGTNGTYDTARMYNGVDRSGGSATGIYNGIMGIAADAGSIGSTTATYNGDAVAAFAGGDESTEFRDGRAALNVNFGSGVASLTMNQFATAGDPARFDTINVLDMNVSGNRFGSGSVTTLLNGSPVDIVGSGVETSVSGVFLGDVVGGVPDEAGGALLLRGSTGTVYGAFVAD